jgi:hypothetical protein
MLTGALTGCADDPHERAGTVTSDESAGSFGEGSSESNEAEELVTDDTTGRLSSGGTGLLYTLESASGRPD